MVPMSPVVVKTSGEKEPHRSQERATKILTRLSDAVTQMDNNCVTLVMEL